jgi:4-carboxymuconolactone decarboxylase
MTPPSQPALAAVAALFALGAVSFARADPPNAPGAVSSVAPALQSYTFDVLLGGLWRRPDLTPRDRSMVTLAALIARNQATELPFYIGLALDNGVKPSEISEVITHLAFYAGWGNAMAAVPAVSEVFAQRGIGADQLPAVSPPLLALDKAADARRAASVQQSVGSVSAGLVQYTNDLLFHDLWLRPGLAPRDRSLVTVSALIASGQLGQLASHLNRGLDNGLTGSEISGVMTHLAFYAGWPYVFSAVPIIKSVFDSRAR